MDERRVKYHAVNGQWPAEIPALTGPEAISAARRLFRFAMKRPYRGKWKLTSGRRYTWQRSHVFYVNPTRGWHALVHDLSHYCHRRLFPRAKPHSTQHHFLEKEMVAYVIKSGWLDGKLVRKSRNILATPKPVARLARVTAAEKRWTTKLRRAETALRKLRRQRVYYAGKVSEATNLPQ